MREINPELSNFYFYEEAKNKNDHFRRIEFEKEKNVSANGESMASNRGIYCKLFSEKLIQKYVKQLKCN